MEFSHKNISTRSREAMKNRSGFLFRFFAPVLILALAIGPAHAIRIKDICSIEGVRSNHLVGYGLVVGLAGTGDDDTALFTLQSLTSYLKTHNIQVDINDIKIENAAGVLVTAELPPFAQQGTRIDVKVASIGSAQNLQGGELIATALRPVGSQDIYAVAQGSVSTGGFALPSRLSTTLIVKNHPTTAVIPNGGIVERTVATSFATKPEITLQLRNPDFTTALRIAEMINHTAGPRVAQARNSATVNVTMPTVGGAHERIQFIGMINQLQVSPDAPARVVYNERTGTVVMGGNVRISSTIITHGNLILKTDVKKEDALQTTVGVNVVDKLLLSREEWELTAIEEKGEFKLLEEGVTIGEVAKALNSLGVSSRDIISILQALKQCGALQAELVAM